MKTEQPGEPRVEYRGLDRRAKRSAAVLKLLQRLMPYERWEQSLPEAKRDLMVGLYGSTLGAYTTLRDGLEQEAEDPTPTTILLRPDGSVVLTWE